MVSKIASALHTLIHDPEFIIHTLLGGVALPVAAGEIPQISGLPWYGTVIIAAGWMLVAVYRIKVKNDTEKRDLKEKVKDLENSNAALEKLIDRLDED